jgi:predicted Zn-dependent peptidase
MDFVITMNAPHGLALRRSRWLPGIFLSLAILAFAPPTFSQQVPVVEKTLSNGMKVLLVPRKDEPNISGGWVAHVGASNERPGITGIAHLFEHMMFKGTPTIGTKDSKADLKIIAEQEKVRDQMRAEEALVRKSFRRGEVDDLLKPESMTPRWRELKKQFDDLVAKQRALMVKNEFDLVYKRSGGTEMNASTSEDMTMYFITIPANKLELWMWMESERLFHPVFREFYSERDVVFEERRMRTESTPTGKFSEEFEAMFWESTPYHWPVVGWPSDLVSISKKQADEFYATYYAPQNVTAILVGDFEIDNAVKLAEKYFGRIPAGKTPAPDVVTVEVKQEAEKRMNAEAETNPEVEILWHTVPYGHKDSYVLDVLGQVLSTRTGRLYKSMVMGSQVATDVVAGQMSRKWAGAFYVGAEVKDPGHTPAEVEEAIYDALEMIKHVEVPADELQKVKNNFAAFQYRRLSSNMPILHQLLEAEGMGDWTEINNADKKIQAVTPADIKRVANLYFTKENRSVAIFTRKEKTAQTAQSQETK